MTTLARMKPYIELMRLNKPIGILLLLWPTLWALWIAGNGHPETKIVAIFVAGVFIMRAAGCIINDIADRKFDGHVTRTKNRPLATGELSVKQAITLFSILCLIALALVCLLNTFTIVLAVIALIGASIYPFTKRFLYFPQLILGASWYVGMLMAFSAQQNHLPKVSWILYLAAVLWTIAYDTMYAMADREDDLQIGLKSTAILFGKQDKSMIAALQILVVLLLYYVGSMQHLGALYFASLCIALMLACYQQYLIRNREPSHCLTAFLNNNWFGMVVFMGIY